jgi:hypothetical protein
MWRESHRATLYSRTCNACNATTNPYKRTCNACNATADSITTQQCPWPAQSPADAPPPRPVPHIHPTSTEHRARSSHQHGPQGWYHPFAEVVKGRTQCVHGHYEGWDAGPYVCTPKSKHPDMHTADSVHSDSTKANHLHTGWQREGGGEVGSWGRVPSAKPTPIKAPSTPCTPPCTSGERCLPPPNTPQPRACGASAPTLQLGVERVEVRLQGLVPNLSTVHPRLSGRGGGWGRASLPAHSTLQHLKHALGCVAKSVLCKNTKGPP